MSNPKPEPPVDFYRERIERITNTAEAQVLRQDIAAAVDAYARFFERHGLEVHISWNRDTEPNNPNDVVIFTGWDDARGRRN